MTTVNVNTGTYLTDEIFDEIRSSYRKVIDQAYRVSRITENTRDELLDDDRFEREVKHIYSVYFASYIAYVDGYHTGTSTAFRNAALNHGMIENGLLSYGDILENHGKETADLVASVTDFRYVDRRGNLLREWIPDRGLRELSWRERKEVSLERLRKSGSEAVLLKLTDTAEELRRIKKNDFHGRRDDWNVLKWYCGELKKLFKNAFTLNNEEYFSFEDGNGFLTDKGCFLEREMRLFGLRYHTLFYSK